MGLPGKIGCLKHPLYVSVLTSVLVASGAAHATEKGTSAYPVGLDTVLTGTYPPQPGCYLFNYTQFYDANRQLGSNGQTVSAPGFGVHTNVDTPRPVCVWKLKILGGNVASWLAFPMIDTRVRTGTAIFAHTGIGPIRLSLFDLAWHRKYVSWVVAPDVRLPTGYYSPTDPSSTGLNRTTYAIEAGVSLTPGKGYLITSKDWYGFNTINQATKYKSGHENVIEGSIEKTVVPKTVELGVAYSYYQQLSDDIQNGVVVNGGNRGRDVLWGPQLRYDIKGGGIVAKYERETMVQNRAEGNRFWVQFLVPLYVPHVRKIPANGN